MAVTMSRRIASIPRARSLASDPEELAVLEPGQQGVPDAVCLRQPEPPDVGADRVLTRDEPTLAAAQRPTPVAGDREVGAQFAGTVGAVIANADHTTLFVQQPGDVMAHPQGECRLFLAGFGEQVEQIPLRHHRDVAVRQP
jgi:hypothetical protein